MIGDLLSPARRTYVSFQVIVEYALLLTAFQSFWVGNLLYGKPVIWHSDDPLSAAALTPSKVTVAVRVCEPHERPVRSLPV